MSDVKISALPAAVNAQFSDLLPTTQDYTTVGTGVTRKLTLTQAFALLVSPPAIGTTTPAAGKFTSLEGTGTATFGSGLANYATVIGGATSGSDGTTTISTLGSATNSHLTLSTKGNSSFVRINRRMLHSTTSNLDTLGGLVAADSVFRMQTSYTYASTAMASHWAVNGTIAGTITSAGGVNSFASFGLVSNAQGGSQALYVQNTIGVLTGGGGNFGAISGQIFVVADTDVWNSFFLTGNSGGTTTTATLGGLYGVGQGNIFGFNYYARAHNTAKHLNQVIGGEINVTTDSNVETYQRNGLQLVIQPNLATGAVDQRAWRNNNAIVVGGGLLYAGMSGWDYAYALAGSSDGWPMNRTWGKFAGLSPFTYTTTPSMGFGIDFAGITINQLAWRSNGATLSGSGTFGATLVSGNSLQTLSGINAKTCVLGSVTVVKPGLFVAIPALTIAGSATIAVGTMEAGRADTWAASPGTNYTANDVLTIAGASGTGAGGTFTTAAQYTVVTVDGSGRPLQLRPTTLGNYTVLPADPVSFTGGTGTGLVATLFWGIRTVTVTSPGSAYAEAPLPLITAANEQADAILIPVMTASDAVLVLNSASRIRAGYTTANGAGTTQGSGTLVTRASTYASNTAGQVAHRLPTATVGDELFFFTSYTSAVGSSLFPASGDRIETAAVDGVFAIPIGTGVDLKCVVAGRWSANLIWG